jgi:hypothetical protein
VLDEAKELTGKPRLERDIAAIKGRMDELMAESAGDAPFIVQATSEQAGSAPRQRRLIAVPDADPPYFLLDGKRLDCKKAVAVHFVEALIKANGGRIAFTEWVKDQPDFLGSRSDRDLKFPKEISPFIERRGNGFKLNVGMLL